MTDTRHVLPFRRKREGKTNYKKRLALLKSGVPRLVIRRSNKHVLLQLVAYQPDGEKVLATLTSKVLAKHGWTHSQKSIPAAYLTGRAFAKQLVAKQQTKAILDLGFQKHRAGTRICAALQGVVDGGVSVPVGAEIFPPGDRINGAHLTTAKPGEVAEVAKRLGVTLPPPTPAPKKEEKKKSGAPAGKDAKDGKDGKPAPNSASAAPKQGEKGVKSEKKADEKKAPPAAES